MHSWKTSLTGSIAAAIIMGNTYISTHNLDLNTVIISILLATLGFLAKDYDKTNAQISVKTHKARLRP